MNKSYFTKCEKVCPVCKGPIVKMSTLFKDAYENCYCCPQQVTLQNGRSYYHYTYDSDISNIRIFMLPFKVMIYKGKAEIFHLNRRAKVNAIAQFKKILTVSPEKLPYGNGEALLNKLNIWNLLS